MSRTITVLLVLVFLLLLFIGYGLVNNRWYHVLAVNGGSMEPTIHWGDLVVITPPGELRPGMIVTMEVGGQIVTHRIVSVDPLVTMGDANSVEDQWSAGDVRVVGVVRFWIPRLGWALQKIHLGSLGASDALFHDRESAGGHLGAADTFNTAGESEPGEATLPVGASPSSDPPPSTSEDPTTLPTQGDSEEPEVVGGNPPATTNEPTATTTTLAGPNPEPAGTD